MLDEIIKAEIKKRNSDPAAIPWVKDFLQHALPPQPNRDLLNLLVGIGCEAYNTTFIGDYDKSPDGLGLSRIKNLPPEQIDMCLKALIRKATSTALFGYVAEFERDYLQETQCAAA